MFRKRFLSLLALPIVLSVLASACAPAAAPTPTAAPTLVPTLVPTLAPTQTVAPTAVPTIAPTLTAAPTSAPTVVPSPTAIVVTDALSHSVTLAAPARRIVSLAPSNTEILFAIGAGSQLVARDDFSTYPDAAKTVPSIGSLYPKVNAEAVVALQPDLVLAAGITNPDDVNALIGLGLTVYATKKDATLDDIFHDILAVGQLTGHVAEAEKLVADLQARVQAVTTKLNGVAQKPLVFYEIDATDPSKPWTAGPGSFIDQLITMAGATNAGDIEVRPPAASDEFS